MASSAQNSLKNPMAMKVIGFLMALDIFIFDRIHKFIQIDIFGWKGGEFKPVLPFLDYVLVWNEGVSYGFLSGLPREIISVGTGMVIAILAVWLWRSDRFLTRLALGMVIAGASSNLIDRIIYGAVADFFHLHWQSWSFYVFNIADAGITIGAILLIIDMFKPVKVTKT